MVIVPAPTCLQIITSEVTQSGPVGREAIGNQHLWSTVAPHHFSQHFQCGLLVSPLCNNAFQYLAFVIYRSQEIVALAFNLHESFVHVPLPFREGTQLLSPFSSDL